MISKDISDMKIIEGPSLEGIMESITKDNEVEFKYLAQQSLTFDGDIKFILEKFVKEIPQKIKMSVKVSGVFSLSSMNVKFDRKKMPTSSQNMDYRTSVVMLVFVTGSFTLFCVYDTQKRKGYFCDLHQRWWTLRLWKTELSLGFLH